MRVRLRLKGSVGSVTLSAPTLGYPSPLATNPTTIPITLGIDAQTGDVVKLAYSASASMSSPTILSYTLQDADASGGTIHIGVPTLVGNTYFQSYLDSTNKSRVVAWGSTGAPTITTSAAQTAYDSVVLAIALTATDTLGVPALVSPDGVQPGWFISGGVDLLQYQIAVVAGVATLQWIGNGTQSLSSPQDYQYNNVYNVIAKAINYGGISSTLAIAATVNAVSVSAFSFTNVTNAPLSTVETSNTVTFSITPTGTPVAASLSDPNSYGFQYSKNGGAYQAAGSFTVQNGDTLTLKVTSGNANSINEAATVTVATQSASWSVRTPGSSAELASTTGINKSANITVSGTPALSFSGSGGSSNSSARTIVEQASAKAQFEVTIVSGATTNWGVGLNDGTTDLSGFAVPGRSDSAGIFVEFFGGTDIAVEWNGNGSSTLLLSAAGTIVNGDIFTIVMDTTVHSIEVWRTRSGTTVQIGSTATGLPTLTHYYCTATDLNAAMSATMNYGATTYAKTPGSGVAAFWG